MKNSTRATTVFSLLLMFSGSVTAQSIFNRNLILNPGAEDGPSVMDPDQAPVTIPNWTTTGTMTVAPYDGSGFLEAVAYGPLNRGSKYFVASSRDANVSTATQTVDLSAAASEIDAGRVRFQLGAYLGATPYAEGRLRATFLDASGKTLLDVVTGDFRREDFYDNGGLLSRTVSGFLLPNTRSVKLVLDLRTTYGGFGGPGADNLSLTLSVDSITGQNLIVNGDAETDKSDDQDFIRAPISGWNTPWGLMAHRYAVSRFQSGDPLPSNRGLNMFAGWEKVTRSAFQTIDVTLIKERIDGSEVNYQLSGWLGGYGTSTDKALLALTFLDAAGQELGRAEVGPVAAQDRGGVSSLIQRTGEGVLPRGTRQVRMTLSLIYMGDPDADSLFAFADDITLMLNASASPLRLSRIANAASGATSNGLPTGGVEISSMVAPGEMVTLEVAGVALDSEARMKLDPDGRVSTELAGVKVLFDGTPAPLLYVSSSRIGAVVPFDVKRTTGGNGVLKQLRVEYQGVRSNILTVGAVDAMPGVFTQEGTATGRGLIYNDDWTLNSAANPAAKGSLVTIIWTGGGEMNPAGVDGRIENGTLPRVAAPVGTLIGGVSTDGVHTNVPFGWAGLLMTQAKVPASAPSGDAVPVKVMVGYAFGSQDGVTMAVR